MARDGTSIILLLARRICRLVATYGTAPIATRYGAPFATAVQALCAAFLALDAQDDYVGEVDGTQPEIGSNNFGPGGGGGGAW